MKIFDAHIYADARPDEDLANMAWFDVARVLACAHAPRTFQAADDLLAYLERHIDVELPRLASLGLTPSAAVGVHPGAIPRRAHYEVWRELPALLARPSVAALGEIGLLEGSEAEWAVVDTQLSILVDHGLDLPVVFGLPREVDTRGRRSHVDRLAALRDHLGLESPIVVQHADWLTVDQVHAHGMVAGVSVGPYFTSVTDAVRLLSHHGPADVVVSTAMRAGQADVLALPKLAVALSEAGVARADIEAIMWGNAARLFAEPGGGDTPT